MAERNAKEVKGDQTFALPSPAGLFYYNNFPGGEDNSEKNTFVHPARLRKSYCIMLSGQGEVY